MALDVAVQIGKGVFQVGFGGVFAFGAVGNGVACITGLVGVCGESQPGADGAVVSTGKKVRDVFLSAVRCIGMSAGTLHWAQFCGWISLGPFAPFIGFIGYPTLFITSIFDLGKQWSAFEAVLDNPNQDYYSHKVGIECLKLISQVCLVAYSVIGAASVVTANPALAAAAFASVLLFGVLVGAAAVLGKKVNNWGLKIRL